MARVAGLLTSSTDCNKPGLRKPSKLVPVAVYDVCAIGSGVQSPANLGELDGLKLSSWAWTRCKFAIANTNKTMDNRDDTFIFDSRTNRQIDRQILGSLFFYSIEHFLSIGWSNNKFFQIWLNDQNSHMIDCTWTIIQIKSNQLYCCSLLILILWPFLLYWSTHLTVGDERIKHTTYRSMCAVSWSLD